MPRYSPLGGAEKTETTVVFYLISGAGLHRQGNINNLRRRCRAVVRGWKSYYRSELKTINKKKKKKKKKKKNHNVGKVAPGPGEDGGIFFCFLFFCSCGERSSRRWNFTREEEVLIVLFSDIKNARAPREKQKQSKEKKKKKKH